MLTHSWSWTWFRVYYVNLLQGTEGFGNSITPKSPFSYTADEVDIVINALSWVELKPHNIVFLNNWLFIEDKFINNFKYNLIQKPHSHEVQSIYFNIQNHTNLINF